MSLKRLNLLIVAESLDVNQSSGARANVALIKNMQKAGFNLLVYHYTRKEISLKDISLISIVENRRSVLFFLSRLERYLRYYLNIKLNKPLERFFGFSFTLMNDRNSIAAALKKEKIFDSDWILTLSQGGSFRPHHALLSLPDWHSKWIAYIHDPYPMHWYPKPYTWNEPGHRIKQKFMEEVADQCRYAAFPSLYLKEWMGSHYKAYAKKGVVIPHQLTKEVEKATSVKLKIDSSEFTVLHAGNFLQARHPKALIKGFKQFKRNYPNAKAKLIHIGPAPHYREYLEKESSENAFLEVICKSQPFNEVVSLQEKASVNVIIEAKADFSPFLPGKFPHCIAARKPILLLGPPRSESRRLLGGNYPYYAEIDDEALITILLEKLYIKWEKRELIADYSEVEEYLSSAYLKKIIENL